MSGTEITEVTGGGALVGCFLVVAFFGSATIIHDLGVIPSIGLIVSTGLLGTFLGNEIEYQYRKRVVN